MLIVDGNYIKVKDKDGQDDWMCIRINDSFGKLLVFNGSDCE